MSPFHDIKDVTLKIVVRYTLLQIPELILIVIGLRVIRIWFDLADWLFWAIILVMVVKEIVLFPFLWRAYDWDNPRHENPLLGRHGVARENLAPRGYIFINGELWQAEVDGEETVIEKDEPVIVTRLQGLTLFVRPAGSRKKDKG